MSPVQLWHFLVPFRIQCCSCFVTRFTASRNDRQDLYGARLTLPFNGISDRCTKIEPFEGGPSNNKAAEPDLRVYLVLRSFSFLHPFERRTFTFCAFCPPHTHFRLHLPSPFRPLYTSHTTTAPHSSMFGLKIVALLGLASLAAAVNCDLPIHEVRCHCKTR